MRIALCSDELYPVHQTLRAELSRRGHQFELFGALASRAPEPWATVAEQAASAVARGQCDQGIFLCWSGTGICMAANKVPGIRAALCRDAADVRACRIWNHANVLCLSNRVLSDDVAKELLEVWFETDPTQQGDLGVQLLREVDARWRKP
jgi:ribose 5-phosphate isomerase B